MAAAQRRASLLSRLGPDHRLGVLLQCTSQERAGAWLYALPRPPMPALAFRCRVQYQLGIPIYGADSRCHSCYGPMDQWGDHVLQCSGVSVMGFRRRHDEVQRSIYQVCRLADVSASQNRRLPLPVRPCTRAEPGDLCFHGYGDGEADI